MAKFKKAFRIFRTMVDETGKYEHDPAAAGELAGTAEKRAGKYRSALGRIWDDLMTFIRMIKAWAKGSYRGAAWKTIAYIIGAVLYFVSPIDMIPDFIPIIGFADDVAVIAWVMRKVQKDVQAFRAWEATSA